MIEVKLESPDRLTLRIWEFRLDEENIKLFLRSYRLERRKSTRHKYRVMGHYGYGVPGMPKIKKEDVPLNDSIKALAIEQVVSKLEVLK